MNVLKFFFAALFCFALFKGNAFEFSSFEELMSEKPISEWNLSERDVEALHFYKQIFLNNIHADPKVVPSIPKTLHFIWIGPKPFPEKSKANIKSWLVFHPDWKVKFWTDSPKNLGMDGIEFHTIDEIPQMPISSLVPKTENYGEKSDLLRYAILFSEGGIYIDHDVTCFRCFEELIQKYDFFAGLESPHFVKELDTRIVVNNGVFGSKPGHPILSAAMHFALREWDAIQINYPGSDRDNDIYRVMKRTFNAFMFGIQSNSNKERNRDIIFPSCFFLPLHGFSKDNFYKLKKQQLVFASHALSGTWHISFPEPVQNLKADLKSKTEKTKKKIEKKLNKIQIRTAFALLIACFFLLTLKRKERKA